MASATVTTIGDQTGVLVRAMAASIADKPLDQLSVAELVVVITCMPRVSAPMSTGDCAMRSTPHSSGNHAPPRVGPAWRCSTSTSTASVSTRYRIRWCGNGVPPSAPSSSIREVSRRGSRWPARMGSSRDLEGLKDAVERAVSINPLNADLVAACARVPVAGRRARSR